MGTTLISRSPEPPVTPGSFRALAASAYPEDEPPPIDKAAELQRKWGTSTGSALLLSLSSTRASPELPSARVAEELTGQLSQYP
jgi:hypothetical protein